MSTESFDAAPNMWERGSVARRGKWDKSEQEWEKKRREVRKNKQAEGRGKREVVGVTFFWFD